MIRKVKWLKGAGMAIWPFVFVNPQYTSRIELTINHEKIHLEQQKEMLIVFFFLWYFIEWIVNVFRYGFKRAYRNISFEREGYDNRSNLLYLSKRKRYAWFKYLRK